MDTDSRSVSGDEIPFGPLEEAIFLSRPNRFVAWVELVGGHVVKAHVGDPGRMVDLLVPGRRAYVRHVPSTTRATEYDLMLVEYQGILVSVNTLMPNRLAAAALRGRRWEEFATCNAVRAEARRGRSRFDFELADGTGGRVIVEVKSVGLMRDGIGWFPDAVTARGRRHVEELAALRREGTRTAIVFIAQRPDVEAIRSAADIDPAFAEALRRASADGVELYGWRCAVSRSGIRLDRRVPVEA